MKHFLGVQNGSIFVSFLCIFTNFFLVLLRKRTFLRLLLCIFTNRKNCRQQTRRCGQYTGSSIQTACEQHAQTSISAGKKQIFSFRRQPPSNISRRQHLFLQSKSQPSAIQQPSLSSITSNFHPSSLSRNLPQKKLSLRLSFSRCI